MASTTRRKHWALVASGFATESSGVQDQHLVGAEISNRTLSTESSSEGKERPDGGWSGKGVVWPTSNLLERTANKDVFQTFRPGRGHVSTPNRNLPGGRGPPHAQLSSQWKDRRDPAVDAPSTENTMSCLVISRAITLRSTSSAAHRTREQASSSLNRRLNEWIPEMN
ncbi:uncharacterized protein EI90DRAFT_3285116 [Cantharellus anzutake]|uniref:uncharacterized protein n=1 Tax=Cantharellus anzutake TaxID=1750568 RepID=UPI0019059F8A|nr:uncharacterized protein EI90DRAFT_3285116 [Cantharellus anzutake]KAF8343100.1 hypothetical protein EI90DRAFT_3285116 [Cantharellus anzutake]